MGGLRRRVGVAIESRSLDRESYAPLQFGDYRLRGRSNTAGLAQILQFEQDNRTREHRLAVDQGRRALADTLRLAGVEPERDVGVEIGAHFRRLSHFFRHFFSSKVLTCGRRPECPMMTPGRFTRAASLSRGSAGTIRTFLPRSSTSMATPFL